MNNAEHFHRCRKPLRDALRNDGWQVDMVGSRHSGTMVDYVRTMPSIKIPSVH